MPDVEGVVDGRIDKEEALRMLVYLALGLLDVYGKPIRLIPDRRLQKLPLLSFLYLSARSVERMLETAARDTRRSCRRHVQRTLRSAGLMKSKRRTRVR